MCPVGTNRGYPDGCPSVQLEMINFGDAELEAPTQLRDQRAYQRALLLKRMHVAEQQVELQRTHPHGHGHSVDTGRPGTRLVLGLASRATLQGVAIVPAARSGERHDRTTQHTSSQRA